MKVYLRMRNQQLKRRLRRKLRSSKKSRLSNLIRTKSLQLIIKRNKNLKRKNKRKKSRSHPGVKHQKAEKLKYKLKAISTS